MIRIIMYYIILQFFHQNNIVLNDPIGLCNSTQWLILLAVGGLKRVVNCSHVGMDHENNVFWEICLSPAHQADSRSTSSSRVTTGEPITPAR